MRSLTPQQLLLLTFLVIGLLVNLLARTLGRRRPPADEPAADRGPVRSDRRPRLPSPGPATVPPVPAPLAAAPAPAPAPPGPVIPGPRRRPRGLRLTAREARRAIVLMTVLGPGRGTAPGEDGPWPGP